MKKMIFCVLLAALGVAPALLGNCTMTDSAGKACTCTNCNMKCKKAKACYTTDKDCTKCKHKSKKHKCTCEKKCCGKKDCKCQKPGYKSYTQKAK